MSSPPHGPGSAGATAVLPDGPQRSGRRLPDRRYAIVAAGQLRFVGVRVLQALIVMMVTSALIFLLVHRIPGDPATVLAGPGASPQAVAAVRHELALDKPLPVQYWAWLSRVLRGDLGTSISTHQHVTTMLGQAVPATLQLAAAAAVFAVILGIALGVLAAVRRGSWVDAVITAFSSVSLGVPPFWLGAVALYVFVLKLPWFTGAGWVDVFRHPAAGLSALVLPALVLGVLQAAVLTRFVRTAMLEVLVQDHVRTARAKGLARPLILWRHGLRNALVPVVTVVGLMLGNLLAGVIVVEVVFTWPGVGTLLVDAVGQRDYPVIQGVLLFLILVFVVINLVVDVLYRYLDPRTRR